MLPGQCGARHTEVLTMFWPSFFPFAILFPSGPKGQGECVTGDRVELVLITGHQLTKEDSGPDYSAWQYKWNRKLFFFFFYGKNTSWPFPWWYCCSPLGSSSVHLSLSSGLPPPHPYSITLAPYHIFCTIDNNRNCYHSSALFVLQGVDQVLPSLPFYQKTF